MKKDDELEDPYELDSISFGKIPMKEMINHNEEFPLRIGTNFFECDSDSFSNQNPNKSLDDILNQRIANNKNINPEARLKYPTQQIIKINKINQSIKSIVVLQNQLKLKLKSKLIQFTTQTKINNGQLKVRKNFGQVVRKIFRNFDNSLSSQRIEQIKFDRISTINPQKRTYYLNIKDQKQMAKRKFIKTLITQKDTQLLKKRGLSKSQQNLNGLKDTVTKYSHYISQCASSIEENKMGAAMNKVTRSDLQELGQQLKNHSAKHQQTMISLNHQIGQKISELLQAQEIVNRKKLKRSMELQTRIISSSENLLEIVPPKRLFSLMPNFNRENFLKI